MMDLEQRTSDERKKWDKPYVFHPYPRMLYRGLATAPGWDYCIVQSEAEAEEKLGNGEGWRDNLPEALKHQERIGADIGLAAAERAAADRRMSAKAQAEAARADEASDGHHLGEIPETPIKKRPAPLRRALGADDVPND